MSEEKEALRKLIMLISDLRAKVRTCRIISCSIRRRAIITATAISSARNQFCIVSPQSFVSSQVMNLSFICYQIKEVRKDQA